MRVWVALCALCASCALLAGALPHAPYQATTHHVSAAWSIDDRSIAYATAGDQKQNLYVVPAAGGPPAVLLPCDGWCGDPAWSPDGKHLAYSAGARDGQQRIWIASAAGSGRRQLTRGFLGSDRVPAWSPDGTQIAFVVFRGPNPRVMIAPSEGGTPRSLADGWRPRWSPDGRRILLTAAAEPGGSISERAAAWIIDVDSGRQRRLDSSAGPGGEWAPSGDWSPDGRRVVFARSANGRTELLLIDVEADRIIAVLPADGSAADPAWSHDGRQVAFTVQSIAHVGEIRTVTTDGKRTVEVTRQRRFPAANLVRFRSADGLEIPAYLVKPASHGRCPALVWVHGGEPGTGATLDRFEPAIQYFVAQGYVVLAPNYRGSVGFGEQLANFPPGSNPGQDLVAAAAYLRSLPEVDGARVGVVGFSAGGLFSVLAAGRNPGAFAAVVDFFGAADLAALYGSTASYRPLLGKLFGGTPEEKPEVYRAASPVTYASQMAAPVLVLHGEQDRVMPISQSDALVAALKAAKKDVTFIRIPGAGHGFFGDDGNRAFESTADFLEQAFAARRGSISQARTD